MSDPITTLIEKLESDKLVELIRVAESSERYEDMAKMLKALVGMKVKEKKDLNEEERNLLSVGFKNIVGTKRASWRTLNGIEEEEIDADLIDNYKKVLESELEQVCGEVLHLLAKQLIPQVDGKNDETEVFYKKMAADYYRYKSEFDPSETNKQNCEDYYKSAYEIAQKTLAETHPTRLGLALNFSVCYYEILKKPEQAVSLAKQAFDAAIAKLDDLNDQNYKDSTLIMQLLRDNLTLWSSNDDADDDGDN